MKTSLLTAVLGLAFAVSAQAGYPVEDTDDRFATLNNLDYSSCAMVGHLMSSRDVQQKVTQAAMRHGMTLKSISFHKADRRDATTCKLQFVRQGSPFGPPQPPKFGVITVQCYLPQDAGWQVGTVSDLRIIEAQAQIPEPTDDFANRIE